MTTEAFHSPHVAFHFIGVFPGLRPFTSSVTAYWPAPVYEPSALTIDGSSWIGHPAPRSSHLTCILPCNAASGRATTIDCERQTLGGVIGILAALLQEVLMMRERRQRWLVFATPLLPRLLTDVSIAVFLVVGCQAVSDGWTIRFLAVGFAIAMIYSIPGRIVLDDAGLRQWRWGRWIKIRWDEVVAVEQTEIKQFEAHWPDEPEFCYTVQGAFGQEIRCEPPIFDCELFRNEVEAHTALKFILSQ